MGCYFLLRGIYLTLGFNLYLLCFLNWQVDFYHHATWEALRDCEQRSSLPAVRRVQCSGKEDGRKAAWHTESAWVIERPELRDDTGDGEEGTGSLRRPSSGRCYRPDHPTGWSGYRVTAGQEHRGGEGKEWSD